MTTGMLHGWTFGDAMRNAQCVSGQVCAWWILVTKYDISIQHWKLKIYQDLQENANPVGFGHVLLSSLFGPSPLVISLSTWTLLHFFLDTESVEPNVWLLGRWLLYPRVCGHSQWSSIAAFSPQVSCPFLAIELKACSFGLIPTWNLEIGDLGSFKNYAPIQELTLVASFCIHWLKSMCIIFYVYHDCHFVRSCWLGLNSVMFHR